MKTQKVCTNRRTPLVGPVFIDKISMTANLSECELVKVEKRILEGEIKLVPQSWRSGYEKNYTFEGIPGFSIQFRPKTGLRRNSFRCEFNPCDERLVKVKRVLNQVVPGGYVQFYHRAIVSKIDVTFDVGGVTPNDIVVHAERTQNGIVTYSGRTGIESMYIGKKGSNKVLKIYNKALEQKSRGLKTRFEYTLKTLGPALDLPSLINPYLSLDVFDVREDEPLIDEALLYCDSYRLRGPNNVFRKLSKPLQDKIRFGLPGAEWWNPEMLWKRGWNKTVNNLFVA